MYVKVFLLSGNRVLAFIALGAFGTFKSLVSFCEMNGVSFYSFTYTPVSVVHSNFDLYILTCSLV